MDTKTTNSAQAEFEGRLASIVRFSNDAIISKDLDGTITSWNPGAERLFGYSEQEAIGKLITIIIPDDRLAEEAIILDHIRHEVVEHFETVRRSKDGRLVDVSLTISPLRDHLGKVIGASKIARDITERKRSEAILRESEKLASAGRMAAAIAHEINNPLQAMTNLCCLLRNEKMSPAAEQLLDMLAADLSRVSHIARQTLTFYLETSKPSVVHLEETVDRVLILLGPTILLKGATIETRYKKSCALFAVESELEQVFSNLLGNSFEAGATIVKIRISSANDGRYGTGKDARKGVCILLGDNGAGISLLSARKLFEPFFTTKIEKGNGLGLWVAKGIIQKHEGSIRLRTSTDPVRHGTVFSIFLPAMSSAQLSKATSIASHRDSAQNFDTA
jgi:two-component system, chemotaxis family, CheB/CheR fusion protein